MKQSDYTIKDLKRFDKNLSTCSNCGAKGTKISIIGSGLRVRNNGASWIHTIDCHNCNVVTEHSIAL
jgi:hypothetical protein